MADERNVAALEMIPLAQWVPGEEAVLA